MLKKNSKHLLYILLIAISLVRETLADEHSSAEAGTTSQINLSLPSEIAKKDLAEIYKIAPPGDINADLEKAISSAIELKSTPAYKNYTQSDKANLNAYLGWAYLQVKNYNSAVISLSEAMSDYSVFDGAAKQTAAIQLIVASLNTDSADKIFEDIYSSYYLQAGDIVDQAQIAGIYAQNNRLDLALKLYELLDELSKNTNDFDRYIYYAYLIKSLAHSNQKDKLTDLSVTYEEEGKSVAWKTLLHWQKEHEDHRFPRERHQPIYPKQAIVQGISGYAVVEYSIDTRGRTYNQRVIEEFPTGVFTSTSLKTIKKFKYSPLVGPDGNAIERHKVTNKFIFSLQGK